MKQFGFILLRHVNSEASSHYWKLAYQQIRAFHPDAPVLIIDDASNPEWIHPEEEVGLHIIKSEYPGRAELLPYIYYLEQKIAHRVCILHDSVFLNRPLNTNVFSHQILWTFEHWYDNPEKETSFIRTLKNSHELLGIYHQKDIWKGCFGGMSIISHDYLIYLQDRYDFRRLIDVIRCRDDRYQFERIIACMLQTDHRREPVFGSIHTYCPWGVSFDERHAYSHLPAVKVWTRR